MAITKRWMEFFEGEDKRLSMMRLTVFMSFWPASYVVMSMQEFGVYTTYVGAYVLGYVGGKGLDKIGTHPKVKK